MILKKTAFLGFLLALSLGPAPIRPALADGTSPKLGDFSPFDPPLPTPNEDFQDALGAPLTLQKFKGQVVVLNFWASWCGPCVAEMPTLDTLQADLGEAGLAVVAISLDRDGVKKAAPFFRRTGVKNLTLYTDRMSDLFQELKGSALPTTYILDRDGKVVSVYIGATNWASDAVKAELKKYLDAKPAG
ncbi:TlpA family protein disulfide reductase [Dongia sp.]|uniref:TlpA family protein disulfide reductase n=1 Tax=Dongia sp. TaxID=1977262 RepID=UPI0035AE332C